MARFTRLLVAGTMKEIPVVPVFYHPNPSVTKNVMKACYQGGIRIFEYTNRGDFAHEIFSEISHWSARELPDMIVGAGTILDASTAALYIQCGANFILSPSLNEEVGKTCHRRKVLWIPGCGSVSEIQKAEEMGAEIVKLFPASELGGPKFIKAVLGPMPWTSIMPTGGVSTDKENLLEWIRAGAYCLGIGSNLITREIIENEDYPGLEHKVREILEVIHQYRSNKNKQ